MILIVEKEAILEDQQDTLSELEQELDELLDKEVLDRTGEGSIHPTSRKLQMVNCGTRPRMTNRFI